MSENDCVFCKIANGEEESEIVYEEEGMMAFHGIGGEATARVHVIPRDFVSSLEVMGVAGPGYTFGVNNGSDAGQEVFDLRAHVLGGRKMEMP